MFCKSAHSFNVYLSIPIILTLVLPAPNSSKSLKIILKCCLAPTDKITGQLFSALGRVKATVSVCQLFFVFSPSEKFELVLPYTTVKILYTISNFNHVLTVVRYLAESRKTICNVLYWTTSPQICFFPSEFFCPPENSNILFKLSFPHLPPPVAFQLFFNA